VEVSRQLYTLATSLQKPVVPIVEESLVELRSTLDIVVKKEIPVRIPV